MVNVTDGPDVAMRFVANEFCLTHGRKPLSREICLVLSNFAYGRITATGRGAD
jgi:hypothetical protein